MKIKGTRLLPYIKSAVGEQSENLHDALALLVVVAVRIKSVVTENSSEALSAKEPTNQ